MKKVSKNILDLILLIVSGIVILGTSFLCYLITPFSSKENSAFIPLIVSIVVLFALTFGFQLFLIKRKNIIINLTLIYGCLIFVSAIILTIVFKIVSVVKPDSIIVKTGLKSILFLFAYYVVILLISLLSFLKKEEKKVLSKKDI